MAKLDIDEIDVDELEDTFLSIIPDGKESEYNKLTTEGEQLQFIIDLIKNSYLPFFDNDLEMERLLDEIDLLVNVDDNNFELTSDIVKSFVDISQIIRSDDTHPKIKDRLLIIITYALELIS